MADPGRKVAPEDYDGRFGDHFDSEVRPGPIIQIVVGLLVLCILGILVTLALERVFVGQQQAAIPPSPIAEANERRLPPGPRLQADPENELAVMRAEQAARLGGYGWVDEVAGTVHIPIDAAIELFLAEQPGDGAVGGEATEPTSPEEHSAVPEGAATHGNAEHAR